MQHGSFVVSLDFELMWGVRDKRTRASYGANIVGEQTVIPRLLDVFAKYGIHATFAVVGFLLFRGKSELLSSLPPLLPTYRQEILSPFGAYLDSLPEANDEDPYHFAPSLVALIRSCNVHEIATHTFSHFYCLEPGPSLEHFRLDLQNALNISAARGMAITSIIFPRNQYSTAHLSICAELGLTAFRGTEESWIYRGRSRFDESPVRRALRLLDAYIPFTGPNCYSYDELLRALPAPAKQPDEAAPPIAGCHAGADQQVARSALILNIPSSRFLRPYSRRLRMLESMRQRRIQSAMTYAAQRRKLFHLWWHPHNFGVDQNENFAFLEALLHHFSRLREEYGFASYTMNELTGALSTQLSVHAHNTGLKGRASA